MMAFRLNVLSIAEFAASSHYYDQNNRRCVVRRSPAADWSSVDAGPQLQARVVTDSIEFPTDITATLVVHQHLGSVGSRRFGLGNVLRGRYHSSELHRYSDRTQAPIGVDGRPLAQMRWVGQRLPNFFRRVA